MAHLTHLMLLMLLMGPPMLWMPTPILDWRSACAGDQKHQRHPMYRSIPFRPKNRPEMAHLTHLMHLMLLMPLTGAPAGLDTSASIPGKPQTAI